MTSAQFTAVGATTDIDLQSIMPTGKDTSDNVVISTLDAAGRTVAMYAWNDWAASEPCWVDDSFSPVEGVSFTPGTGLWVQGSAADQGFQTAGAVGKDDVTVQLCFGFTATGNPFPVSIDLQDIVPSGDDTSDNVVISTLDAAGRTVAMYAWNDWAADEPCWVDDSFSKVEGVTFEAGAGLWVQGSSSTQAITFPAPEL